MTRLCKIGCLWDTQYYVWRMSRVFLQDEVKASAMLQKAIEGGDLGLCNGPLIGLLAQQPVRSALNHCLFCAHNGLPGFGSSTP
jgi:hypothetical protein